MVARITISYLIFVIVFASCASHRANDVIEVKRIDEKSAQSIESPGCLSMMDQYCSELNSPSAQGNLLIDRKKPILILRGETPNDFTQVFLKYSLAKIRNRQRLPQDFTSTLDKYSYFELLDEFLHRNPVTKMSLEERLRSENLNYQLGSIWQSAIDQTIIDRMSKKFHGFHQIPDRLMPVEYDVEQRRIKRKLISEFSKAIWRDDANWKKVTEGFNELKKDFFILFNKLDLPTEILSDWRNKIQNLDLVPPGSMPEISDEECSTTQANAFYYRYLNVITVCAGDFNSEDILLTLAHEMSHSLDLSRFLYKSLRTSKVGEDLSDIRDLTCNKNTELSCDKWSDFKKNLSAELLEAQQIKPQLYDFQKCLKKRSDTKTIQDSDVERVADQIANSRISYLAAQNLFLRLIKDKLPMRNGKSQKNPNYMDPCGYYLWSKGEEPIDDEINTLIFFANEYKCSAGADLDKLKSSIETAKQLTAQILQTTIRLEGEFSERDEMTAQGLSSPPFERFADVVGTYAVSEFLKNLPSEWDKRTKFLASTTWLCEEPSLGTKFPEESKVERQYTIESHTEGQNRKMEMLSIPIRQVLKCEKDFKFEECSLPFKH